jgi:hypothetical protein
MAKHEKCFKKVLLINGLRRNDDAVKTKAGIPKKNTGFLMKYEKIVPYGCQLKNPSKISSSSISFFTCTSRALLPWLGPTMPAASN